MPLHYTGLFNILLRISPMHLCAPFNIATFGVSASVHINKIYTAVLGAAIHGTKTCFAERITWCDFTKLQ